MTITQKVYEEFARLLEEDKVYLDPETNFRTICCSLDVDPYEFDEFLMRELGFRGEEILERYRLLY